MRKVEKKKNVMAVECWNIWNNKPTWNIWLRAAIQVHADQEEGGPRSPTSRELSASRRLEN